MRYWITIKDGMCESDARQLWNKIESAKPNMIVLDESVSIYGEAPEVAVQMILFQCGKTGQEIQFNIG